jgi:hypothetical protein
MRCPVVNLNEQLPDSLIAISQSKTTGPLKAGIYNVVTECRPSPASDGRIRLMERGALSVGLVSAVLEDPVTVLPSPGGL